jgi:phosphoribosyl 1,2-cyclic phosphodiesterase
VSYTVEAEGVKIGMAADLGMPTALVKARLQGAHGLILEANHCPDMLRAGPYPPAIQQRIRGRNGHLSNQSMASLLRHISHPKLRHVVLVHLSEENNDHNLALEAAREALAGVPAQLAIAAAERPTPWFEVTP